MATNPLADCCLLLQVEGAGGTVFLDPDEDAEFVAALGRLLDRGWVRRSSAEERLAASNDADELKAMARAKGLPVSGTKATLAARLLPTLSDSERAAVEAVHLVEITEAGQSWAHRTLEDAEREKPRMFDLITAAFAARDRESAVAGTARAIFLRGEEPNGSAPTLEESTALATERWPLASRLATLAFADLSVTPPERRRFGATLAAAYMLGEELDDLGARLIAVVGKPFPCDVMDWANDDPIFAAHAYAEWKQFEAMNAIELDRLLSDQAADIVVRHCGTCQAGGRPFTVYPRGRLIELPRLPRDWSCRCTYGAVGD